MHIARDLGLDEADPSKISDKVSLQSPLSLRIALSCIKPKFFNRLGLEQLHVTLAEMEGRNCTPLSRPIPLGVDPTLRRSPRAPSAIDCSNSQTSPT